MCFACGPGYLSAQETTDAPDERLRSATTAELLKRIEQLEARIAELEKRNQPAPVIPSLPVVPPPQLKTLPQTPKGSPVPNNSIPFTQPLPLDVPPATKTVPNYWHKGMINGRPFYIIPLGEQKTVSR